MHCIVLHCTGSEPRYVECPPRISADCQTNGGGFQAPLTNVTVTDDSLVLFFNTELFFLSVFAVDSALYDSSIVGTEVQEGEDQVVM